MSSLSMSISTPPNRDTAPVVSVRGVAHTYGTTRALDALDLDIPAGCIVGLIGPDGVGKSTLMGLIAGSKKIQAGSVRVLGGDMAEPIHRDAACPRIAFMPQGLGKNLYLELSVFENIDFFARLFGVPNAERAGRIHALLDATGLGPFPDRPAGKLSGGMKQKVGLCGALIHDPDLLILDEPTTGVDPVSRQQFWSLIDHVRADRPGMSVLVSTAYMDEAQRFDWTIAMDAGRVIATGTPAQLMERTGAANLEDAFVALLPGAEAGGRHALEIPPRVDPGGEPAIQATDLTKRFGSFTAVNRVSFAIGRGEIFGFLGSNGCGKSTTMKMLTGLLPATEGQAEALRRSCRRQRPGHAQARRLHVAGLLPLRRAHGPSEPRTPRPHLRPPSRPCPRPDRRTCRSVRPPRPSRRRLGGAPPGAQATAVLGRRRSA